MTFYAILENIYAKKHLVFYQPKELRLLVDPLLAEGVVHCAPQLLLEDVVLVLLASAPRGRRPPRRRIWFLATCGTNSKFPNSRDSFCDRQGCFGLH